ncbi:MAG: ABC transporter ATP-binding protein [Actinomycetota bacterium]
MVTAEATDLVELAWREHSDAESSPSLDVIGVSRAFGKTYALRDVSLDVAPGEITALLGPNGAGKTTLLRILSGLVDPHQGEVRLLGKPLAQIRKRERRLIGLVPSGDRSFYLRLSGLENLVFFGRLYGLSHGAAVADAWLRLEQVGLGEVGRRPVAQYSHGMQKRLSVARALQGDPSVLLVDEATHDLDPNGARQIQELISSVAKRGAAVLWATQRLDEIRDFADSVVVLAKGEVRFSGPIDNLVSVLPSRRYLIRVSHEGSPEEFQERANSHHLGATASLALRDEDRFVLSLYDGGILSDAILALTGAGAQVLTCNELRSEIEQAFLELTEAS